MTSQVFMPFIPSADLTGRTHDPYFANVVLLLHGIGANGGTTITDSSSFNKTITNRGVTTSTAQAKFGSTSLLFGGNTGTSKNFSATLGADGTMTGDFTIEAWVRDGGNNCIFFAGSYNATDIYYPYSNGFNKDNAGLSSVFAYAMTTNFVNGAWHFITISRVGSNVYCFADGVLSSTNVLASTVDLSGGGTSMRWSNFGPNNTGNLNWQGYMQEIRITKGVGRYTATFTVPSTPFPNF